MDEKMIILKLQEQMNKIKTVRKYSRQIISINKKLNYPENRKYLLAMQETVKSLKEYERSLYNKVQYYKHKLNAEWYEKKREYDRNYRRQRRENNRATTDVVAMH